MNYKLNKLFSLALVALSATVIIMFARREKEDLVTESEVIVSHHDFDKKVMETPFETATFGMG